MMEELIRRSGMVKLNIVECLRRQAESASMLPEHWLMSAAATHIETLNAKIVELEELLHIEHVNRPIAD